MLKIKDLNVGQLVNITLVAMSATARETKAKKPYLQLELFDGTDKIQGNYWDWISGKIPEVNTILDVAAQVTEYNGAKQLNIKSMSANTERHLSEFQPRAGVDIEKTYKEAYACTLNVQDDFLRNVTLAALEQLSHLWLEVPAAKSVHHAFVGGTLVHSLAVAKLACAMSKQIPDSNDDLCFVGGLLHDIGKLFTYRINGISIGMTSDGMLFEHIFIGAQFISNFAEQFMGPDDEPKLDLLRHIILSHHGRLEYGSPVTPACIEAYVVNRADDLDASIQQIREQSDKLGEVKWTDKIYTLSNKPHLTTQYVREVFLGEEE